MVRFAAKKFLGVLCLVVGLLALVTPLTPGSWLALIGLELLGLSALLPPKLRMRWELTKEKLRSHVSRVWAMMRRKLGYATEPIKE